MDILLWILNFLSIIYKVKAFASGIIPESCESMLVHHESRGVVLQPQTNDSRLFEVELVIAGLDLITVTLRSSAPFKGFMMEARNKVDSRPVAGKFLILDPAQTRLLDCNGLPGSAVSQRDNVPKNEIRVNWTSETGDLDVKFRSVGRMQR